MKADNRGIGLLLAAVICAGVTQTERSQAQSLKEESGANGTGTTVTPNGNRYDIDGGKQTGSNLFHSFQQFGLNSGEVANFLSNPAIGNILGRVVGGNPSVINGTIRVTVQGGGGNPNLFLMNPAGIIFGSNASLSVPASFTATTATGIGFGNNWFNATGANNYAALVGTPNAFVFNTQNSGVIVNAGNLSVSYGNDLTLVGGTVVNTGKLSGGQITITAVSGGKVVRISLVGNLLSLDVKSLTAADGQPGNWVLPIKSLPELLTGGDVSSATKMTVNGNGQVVLTGSGIKIDPNTGTATISGTLDASKLNVQTQGNLIAEDSNLRSSKNMHLEAQGDLTIKNSQLGALLFGAPQGSIQLEAQNISLENSRLESIGNIQVLAQNTVKVRDSVGKPFAAQAGGNLYIQGKQGIDIETLKHPQSVFQSDGNLSLASNGEILGDGRFWSRGNFSIVNLSGTPGNFRQSPAISSNRIISSEGDVSFGNYEGVSLKVEAIGSISAGNIKITGADTSIVSGTDPDIALLSGGSALILRSGLTKLQNSPSASQRTATNLSLSSQPSQSANITVGNIETSDNFSFDRLSGNPVILSATGNIKAGTISANGDVTLSSTTGNIEVKYVNARNDFGYKIDIAAAGTFRATDSFKVDTRQDSFPIKDNPALLDAYSKITGIPKDKLIANDTRIQLRIEDLPTSILSSPGFSRRGSISIKQGSNSFVTGPLVSTTNEPALVGDFGYRRNVAYSPINVPSNSSGTAGAIVLTNFDASLAKTLQDQTFSQDITSNGVQLTFLPSQSTTATTGTTTNTGTTTATGTTTNTGTATATNTTTNTVTTATTSTTTNQVTTTTTTATSNTIATTATTTTNPVITATVSQQVKQPPPREMSVQQLEPDKPADERDCDAIDAKIIASNLNSSRQSEESRATRTATATNPSKDKCDRRNRTTPTETNPVSAPDAIAPDVPASKTQPVKKSSEPKTIWQFK